MEFLENLDLLSIEKIRQTEVCTRGQCYNEQWYLCRKVVITASKATVVITKMKKVRKGGGGVVNIWLLKENISGKIFVNPNIPALKYGRGIKIDAFNTFAEYKWVLDNTMSYTGVSPDWLMSCSCCGKACI